MLPVNHGVFGPIGKRESVTSRPIKFDHSRGVANESRLVGKFKRGMGEGENHETSLGLRIISKSPKNLPGLRKLSKHASIGLKFRT